MHEERESIRFDSVCDLTPQEISDADLVVILTGHSCVDYESVIRSARAVLDTKNATFSVRSCMGNKWVL